MIDKKEYHNRYYVIGDIPFIIEMLRLGEIRARERRSRSCLKPHEHPSWRSHDHPSWRSQ